MGCIYSKAIARSMSIRDELSNHGFQSSAVTWEELLSSHSGTDQLFALVTQRTSNFTLPSARDPEVNKCRDSSTFTRSRSYDQITENKLDCKYKSQTGSRSFHTVEEYNAMLERIQKFRTRSVQHFGEDYNSPEDDVGNKSQTRDPLGNNFEDVERVVQVDSTRETGWKRKAAAKELTPLNVPSIEFPGIGRNGEQLADVEGGQIYSAETYVTPKFGSYNGRIYSGMEDGDDGQNPVFSRELLAAFEDCMQQLQEEEESIIWQIGEGSLAEDENSYQCSHR